MNQNYGYIELSFIKDFNEIKRQVINTVAVSFLLNEKNATTLDYYLENTQYGYTASALQEGSFHILRITDINNGTVNWSSVPYCECKESDKYLLKKDDILIARTGGTTGKNFLIKDLPSNAIFASYLIRLRANKKCLPEFLDIFLNSYVFWSQISELKSGSAQPNVNAEKLKTLLVPKCSIDEQKKIVSVINNDKTDKSDNFVNQLKGKIESVISLLEDNDAIKKELDQQQSFLKLLRQTILQEAVQGKLTKQFQLLSGANDEPASELLKRIKAEKQKLIKEGKLKKAKELPPIAEDEIPFELPKGWVWCKLENVSLNIHYGFNASANSDKTEVRLLRITDIQGNKVDWSKVPGCIISDKELISYELNENDILIARTGGTIGKSYLVKDLSVRAVFASYLIRVIPSTLIDVNYLKLFIESPIYWKQLIDLSSGTGQPNVNGTSLKGLLTPLPPLPEQQRVVTKVQQLQEQLNTLETQVYQSRQYAQQLLQAVLKEAFEVNKKEYATNEQLTMAAEN